MRQRIWFAPCPLVGLRAVILGPPRFWLHRMFGFHRILYRDIDGRCRYTIAKGDCIIERSRESYRRGDRTALL